MYQPIKTSCNNHCISIIFTGRGYAPKKIYTVWGSIIFQMYPSMQPINFGGKSGVTYGSHDTGASKTMKGSPSPLLHVRNLHIMYKDVCSFLILIIYYFSFKRQLYVRPCFLVITKHTSFSFAMKRVMSLSLLHL